MKLRASISVARAILNDPDGVTFTDQELLTYANDGLKTLVRMAPKFFYARGEIECEAGKVEQVVSFADAHSIVRVDRVKDGNWVEFIDKSALDRFLPSWATVPPGPALNWMQNADSPVRFYIYPPSPLGQILEITYVRIPGEYLADDEIDIPDTLTPTIADYIVYRAMSKDDEHVNANRAQAYFDSFAARVKEV